MHTTHHLSEPPVGEDVPGMDKAIEHLCCLFNQVTLVVLELIVRFKVQDGVQCLTVMGNLLIQASQVELVLNVVLIHL